MVSFCFYRMRNQRASLVVTFPIWALHSAHLGVPLRHRSLPVPLESKLRAKAVV